MFVVSDINGAADSTTINVALSVLNLTLVDSLHNLVMRERFGRQYFYRSFALSSILFRVLFHYLFPFCGDFGSHKGQYCDESEKSSF